MTLQEQWRRVPGGFKRRPWLAPLTLLLLACAVGVTVDGRGGWVNVLGLPPALDGSTPAAQGGFTLLALQAPPDAGAEFQYQRQPGTGGSPYSQEPETLHVWGMDLGTGDPAGGAWVSLPPATFFTAKDLAAMGRASTGETFPLRVTMPQSSNSDQLLFVALPGGYPDALRSLDITLTSRQGQAAHWRITRLPRMRHVTPPPVPQDTFERGGARLTLQATRQPYRGRPGAYIRYRLSPLIAPHTHQWEWDTEPDKDKAQTDWEGYPRGARHEFARMPLTGPGARQEMAFLHGAVLEEFIQNPFVASDHFVTLSGTLTQFETYDERVTFHDVRAEGDDGVFTVGQAQTRVTPSGITVTLPAQSRATFMQGSTLVEPGLLLDVAPSASLNTLTSSPLSRVYHRPVGISLDFERPLGAGIQTIGPSPRRKYGLFVPGRKPVLLRTLTVIVRQRVDLRSWPLSLTAPIQDTRATPDHLVPVPPEGLHA